MKIAAEENNINLMRCYHTSCRYVNPSWYIQQKDLEQKYEDCNLRFV